jgi:arylsulfatase A
MDRRAFLKGVGSAAVSAALGPKLLGAQTPGRKPNIIFILCDDLGSAEAGCYGQEKLRTPTIDKLASEGMRFTQFYGGGPVCAPSRCCLMTGLHTGHACIRDNAEQGVEGQRPMPPDTFTIGTALKQQGYTTACIGKWGLGGPNAASNPAKVGIDYFYGHLCQRVAHNHYADHIWRNDTRIELEGNAAGNFKGKQYTPDLMANDALDFIRKNKDNPFFLYFATPLPHLGLQAPDDAVKPFIGLWEDPAYHGKQYNPCEHPRATYAGMVSLIDSYTARILALLKELNLEDDTIVMFGSDHGPTFKAGGSDSKFFHSAGDLRGLKMDLYEGGIRVPFIVRWPDKVKAGSVTDQIGAYWDILPTITDALNIPTPANLDGQSLLPTLTANGKQSQHEFMYWEFHQYPGQAVRMGNWKAVRTQLKKHPDAPVQLYDLATDISESKDVAPDHPDIAKKMMEIMKTARTPSDFAEWNFA